MTEQLKEAAQAHSDLNLFAAVAALMESSLVSSNCYAAEAVIVRICLREQQKCLTRYDRAVAKAGGGTMAKKATGKSKKGPAVKIANGWRGKFRRGDTVTLTGKGRRTELVVTSTLDNPR